MLTKKRIFLLWIPLAGMWLLIGAEQPAITAVIARFENAKIQLAAFGVAHSFLFIFMSPTIQLLSASTALSADRESYAKLFRFSLLLCGTMTALLLLFGATPVFPLLLSRVFNIPEEIILPARRAYFAMTPFVLFVGMRRLWQGALIRYGHTPIVALAMITRIFTVIAVLAVGIRFLEVDGAILGGIALSIGAFTAAVATFFPFHRVLRREMPEKAAETGPALTGRFLVLFYLPLALTGVVNLAVQPLFTVGLAFAPDSLDSLATWPVIHAFLVMFISVVFSYQDIVVALYKGPEEFKPFKGFTGYLAGIAGSVFLLTAVLPLSGLWYEHVAGLPPDLQALTRLPMIVLAATPAVAAFVSWYRGILIVRKTTVHIIRGAAIFLTVVAAALFFGVNVLPISGVLVAVIAWIVGLIAEFFYLHRKVFGRKKTAGPLPGDRAVSP